MRYLSPKCAAMILVSAAMLYGGVGQSAVITLVFPYGARSCAMGEVGTALADDESVLFFNPAGLCRPNKRFQGGAGSFFFEPILPAFDLPELWHASIAGNYQDSTLWFQPGFFWNYINMGINEWTDELGHSLGKARSYEEVLAIGFGMDFRDIGITDHYFGLTAKYVYSALAPGIGGGSESSDSPLLMGMTIFRPRKPGVGTTYAIDFGYLWDIGQGFRLGATFMNMGPSIYYIDPEKTDPIPFTINLALAYQNSFPIDDLPFIDVAGEIRLDREVVKNYRDKKPDPFYKALWTDLLHDKDESLENELMQINEHAGGELCVMKTASLRAGWIIDLVGERYELHWGFGGTILNHFSLDWAYIISPDGFMKPFARLFDPHKTGASGARDGQWQISLTATRLLHWSDDDWSWWEARG